MRKFLICIVIILSSGVTFKIYEKVTILRSESYKNKIISDYRKKLKECFDLENKNQRRIIESLDLIKYCMKEFGID